MIEAALTVQVAVWLIAVGVFLWARQSSVFQPATVCFVFYGMDFVLWPILACCFGFDSSWIYLEFKPADAGSARTLAVTPVALIWIVAVSPMVGRSGLEFVSIKPPVFARARRRGLLLATLLLPVIAYSIYNTRNGVQA